MLPYVVVTEKMPGKPTVTLDVKPLALVLVSVVAVESDLVSVVAVVCEYEENHPMNFHAPPIIISVPDRSEASEIAQHLNL